jgi:hypothetical protein
VHHIETNGRREKAQYQALQQGQRPEGSEKDQVNINCGQGSQKNNGLAKQMPIARGGFLAGFKISANAAFQLG